MYVAPSHISLCCNTSCRLHFKANVNVLIQYIQILYVDISFDARGLYSGPEINLSYVVAEIVTVVKDLLCLLHNSWKNALFPESIKVVFDNISRWTEDQTSPSMRLDNKTACAGCCLQIKMD